MSSCLERDKVRVLIPYDPKVARYNAAVIRVGGNSIFLAREVPRDGVMPGIPDRGKLIIYRLEPELPEAKMIGQLDLSHGEINNWEDARACSGKNGEVLIGLTAIRARDNRPVAATVRGNIVDNNFSINKESLIVYPNDEGKNVTPISLNQFLFRREGFRHSLEVIEYNENEEGEKKIKVIRTIEFTKRPWCEWQIGTQAQLLPGGILPIHGVNRFSLGVDQHTGEEVFGYAYSLGLALLDEDLNVVDMSDTPLFTRESFKDILPMGKELDANKDVIYCCGYSVDGDIIKFVINIGDLMTVEVTKSLLELRKELRLGSPFAII
ncbi:MAG: hypothetical protein Q8P53_04045 [Candidatus Shapirobacteria bacterium]|nr:hypothetical protein [Candidatus Shapirobacteria bacterium]